MMNFEVELSGLSESQHSEFRIQNSLLVFPVSSTGYQAPCAGGRAYVRLRLFLATDYNAHLFLILLSIRFQL